MPLRRAWWSRVASPLRLIVAVGLAFAILVGAAAVGVVSAGRHCSMPCCADGEMEGCGGGSCSVDLSSMGTPRKPTPEPAPADDDPLCGAHPARSDAAVKEAHAHPAPRSRPTRAGRRVGRAHEADHNAARHGTPSAPAVSGSAIARPCPPGCGAGVLTFSQFRRSKESAPPSVAAWARLPPRGQRIRHAFALPLASAVWGRPFVPRGPPRARPV